MSEPSPARRRAWVSWSSGKDSTLALAEARTDPGLEVVGLLTTVNEDADRVAMHAVRRSLLEAQAEALGLPLHVVPIPQACRNETYEQRMASAIDAALADGVTRMVFGDLFLTDVRSYREQMMAPTGIEPVFPLWGRPTRELARQMLDRGVRATLTCVDPGQLDARFVGRIFDADLLADLPPGVDPCGENGEFHTFVHDGPGFAHPLDVRVGEVVERDGFAFADVVPTPVTPVRAVKLSVVSSPLIRQVQAEVELLTPELIEFRRDLHAHPELSWAEERTSSVIAKRLDEAGLKPRPLPRSGLVVDIGSGPGPVVALRADLDALPVEDRTTDPWRSTVKGVAHACGHDVHASALLGAGLALATVADRLPGRVRLVFQPAEEIMPGGALMSIEAGALDGVSRIFGLHADPGIDVGTVGLREGPLTGAADSLDVLLSGKGGHTSRPHLTEDLTFALGKLVTELPAVLSRRLDPRAGVSVVWGIVRAGSAINVIPATGRAGGTVRMLDAVAWADAEALVRDTIEQIVEPYGVVPTITYVRGVPPVVNEHRSTVLLGQAIEGVLGEEAHVATPQSLGGEDFAWYLDRVPGAMARLGTRTPGGPTYDLHQGNLRVDERSISVGAVVLAAAAITSMVTDA